MSKKKWIFLIVGLTAAIYLGIRIVRTPAQMENLEWLPSQGKIPDDTTGFKEPLDTVWKK